MIGKVLVGAAAALISLGLAAPASAAPQDFLAAIRAAGITGTDPAILADGYDVCSALWNPGNASRQTKSPRSVQSPPISTPRAIKLVAGLVRDHPGLTTDEAAHFVTAAYNDLCPVPGSYDYWAYSTS